MKTNSKQLTSSILVNCLQNEYSLNNDNRDIKLQKGEYIFRDQFGFIWADNSKSLRGGRYHLLQNLTEQSFMVYSPLLIIVARHSYYITENGVPVFYGAPYDKIFMYRFGICYVKYKIEGKEYTKSIQKDARIKAKHHVKFFKP